MKSYKVYYTKVSGLNQVGDLQAYCCIFKDGTYFFYMDDDSKSKDMWFKSINKDYVMYIGEVV